MSEDYFEFFQNPKIDILFGYVGFTIPSKKEDFKPIKAYHVSDSGKEETINNFYTKKPSTKSVHEFENLVRELLQYISKVIS